MKSDYGRMIERIRNMHRGQLDELIFDIDDPETIIMLMAACQNYLMKDPRTIGESEFTENLKRDLARRIRESKE